MNLNRFVTDRAATWERFERELERSRGRPESLGVSGALALGRDYRAVVADLAVARRRFPGDPVLARLEQLALAGRQAIYGRRRRMAGAIMAFATRGYWRTVAQGPGALLVAILAIAVPCLLAAVWAIHDPVAALGLVPGQFKAASHPHVHHDPLSAAASAGFASSIFTNNIEVTFLAFAGGLTFGLGTLCVLAYNGALLGAIAGITVRIHAFSILLRYVLPHGVLELSCIAVVGSAGLRLAWAMIAPGIAPRGEALRAAARPAVLIALGTAPWLVVAGCTEGFVTPHGLPLAAALAVGLTLGGLYWSLVLARGRARTPASDTGTTRTASTWSGLQARARALASR